MSFLVKAPVKFVSNVVEDSGQLVHDLSEGLIGASHRHHHHPAPMNEAQLAEQRLLLQDQQRQLEAQRLQQERQKAMEDQKYIDEKLEMGHKALNGCDYREAISQFRLVLTRSPNHEEARQRLKEAQKELGHQYRKENRHFDALEEYVKADVFEEIPQIVEILLQKATEIEQQADENFQKGTLKDIQAALTSYRSIQKDLSKIDSLIPVTNWIDLRPKHLSHCRNVIEKKIEEAERKIRTIKAMDLIQKANQQFETLNKIGSDAAEEEGEEGPASLFSTKESAQEYLRKLLEVDNLYQLAFQLDKGCFPVSGHTHLQHIIKETKEKIDLFTTHELLDTLKQNQDALRLCSLKEKQHLSRIVAKCDAWIHSYENLTALTDARDKAAMKQTIEEIRNQATLSLQRLETIGDCVIDIAQNALKERDANAYLSEKEQQLLKNAYENLFATSPHLCNQLIALSETGWALFTQRVKTHLSSVATPASSLLNYCCLPFCCGRKYKLVPHSFPLSQLTSQWLYEASRYGTMLDILEKIDGSFPVQMRTSQQNISSSYSDDEIPATQQIYVEGPDLF